MNWSTAFRIKEFPEDFYVSEVLSLENQTDTRCRNFFYYFKLIKSGFTTFQAVEFIAQYFHIDRNNISYCGLKDEDGVTEQWICIDLPAQDLENPFSSQRLIIETQGANFIHLIFCGNFGECLQIGGLDGNVFRLRIRSIDASRLKTRELLATQQTISAINYYDTQRFGVPDAPKTTHIIGEMLLNNNYEEAFEILKRAETPESKKALDWQFEEKEFFNSLDKRVVAFFMSAYSSFQWNSAINQYVRENLREEQYRSYSVDGVEYIAISSQKFLLKAFAELPSIEYRRYKPTKESFAYDVVERPTVIQTRPRIITIKDDEANTSMFNMEVSFFLPPGCYATNVIRQWLLPHFI